MQQTGFNIIAIGIFTITLSVLLGPIFNISPLIPTLSTVIIMGFITIDTLAYENQGINLFLGLFASEEERQRIIYHEAGHFLTAYLLEIPIIGYTLTPWETFKQKQLGNGGVILQPDYLQEKSKDLKEFNLILDRFCIVLMAGIAAENLIYNNHQGGEEDLQTLSKALYSLGLNSTFSQQKQRWAILQATNLIKENQSSYEALMEVMKSRKSVSECYQILNHS